MNSNYDDPSLGEDARLDALKSYEILDTPPEAVFDEIASLAASIAGAPIALISLVAGSRQWFKATIGLPLDQTPRDVAFCNHTIRGKDLLVVRDATLDERFAANPLVTGDPAIRFYAGAPLVTAEGHALGALCIIDYVPREFTQEQGEALQTLSTHVVAQLELRRRLAQFTQDSAARQQVSADLRRAIDANEFELFYQPTIDVRTGHIASLEALLRWNRPGRGRAPASEFLSILERSGLIVAVGVWVMKTATDDYRDWLSRGLTAPRITVNVSPAQLWHPDFVLQLSEALDPDGQSRVPLDIEITERVLIEDTAVGIAKLREIQKMGVHIAVDDFGTGYSALRHLAHLPIDTLKIERAFVAQMTESADSMGLVSNIISLAHGLNLGIVAKGVETEEQRKLLKLLRCDHMQGYIFGRPVPKSEMEQILRRDQEETAAEWRQLLGDAAPRSNG
jgi:EAL domain-containing protein (putative c-di-GMP-specific phosphodiesterase class I)